MNAFSVRMLGNAETCPRNECNKNEHVEMDEK